MRRAIVVLGCSALAAAAASIALTAPRAVLRVAHRSGAPNVSDRGGHGSTAARSGSAQAASRCASASPPVPEHPISHREWLGGVVITEYYPAPERWFAGHRVAAPGLNGTFAVDWLYSARGLAMEGDGVDRRAHRVHIAWLRGGWRNRKGEVTFPLASGGWSIRRGVRRLPYGGVSFAPGPSLPLRYYHSIAVDPRLIPLRSHVYIPAYRQLGGGWFIAQDTGGAIIARHIDVYRPPPQLPFTGQSLQNQRVYIVPRAARPRALPRCHP
jgi:hypothetical protein